MHDVVIVGAGPAGLAAGYELARSGASVVVVEKARQVGGLCQTVKHQGCRYDVGPHRFFTKNAEVHQLWAGILRDDLLTVPRLTRIFYAGKYFDYPLKPLNALFGLGPAAAVAVGASYLSTRLRQRLAAVDPRNFEEWVTLQFGRRLYETFFRTYTEKVWGIPCTQIGPEWAGQRIKGLSLWSALVDSVFRPNQREIKTLLNEFVFPRLGAGMFYDRLSDEIEARGGQVVVGQEVVQFIREDDRLRAAVARGVDGQRVDYEGRHFLCTAPLTELVLRTQPGPPPPVAQAARSLRYRSHIGVDLEVAGSPFPDDWIYVHSRDVRLGRISNYRNFSGDMARDDEVSPLTVEYFVFAGDDLWRSADDDLIALATSELEQMGILQPGEVRTGFVVRSEHAYPVLELGCDRHINVLRHWLDGIRNLQPIGRSGMFKYNNQDHSIATGLLAARNVLGSSYDVWRVNVDAEYHEAGNTRPVAAA